ncbi:helix-turn-helix domain-containing protein [Schaalia turicensis]|uniref:helix-turn-helix domain-containing protein n=1 Tax=Schaalia turicensis TaxID=131111 RepID=UPI001C5EE868|nr:hypothetical protein [Schaalia turicensis]EFQ0234009.1 hypothetical protein [Shigella flexneri]QYB16796.1 hypothetical protein G5S47_08090 [Schaalia turicensis]
MMHLTTRIAYRYHGQGRERVETLGEILAWTRADEGAMCRFGEMEEAMRTRGDLPAYDEDEGELDETKEFDLERDFAKVTLEDLSRLLDDAGVRIWRRPRMSNADFRAMREYLGLPAQWLAERLEVNTRTVQKWDSGEARIPEGISLQMESLESFTGGVVARFVDELHDDAEVYFEIPRTHEDLEEVEEYADMPLDWWRMVGARVRTEHGAVLGWM